MAAPRAHLSKAPAREALIDLQFEPHLSLAEVDEFVAAAAPAFERQVELAEATIGFGLNGPAPATSHSIIGRRLDNEKTHFVLQSRLNGFTLSRLSPYGEWAELRGEALKWWTLLRRTAKDRTITRIGVRYINAITIPLPVESFDDYLTCAPRVPAEFPQGVSGFLQRVIVPDDVGCCTSVVTQALEAQPPVEDGASPGAITVLLDIDVFRPTTVDPDRDHDAWAGLDELRDQKNRIFFAYLTEKAVEMFE